MARPKQKWWVSIVAGVGIAFLSYCAFEYFTKAEQGLRDSETMPMFFVLIYQLLGRWGVLVLGTLAGLASVVAGITELKESFRRTNHETSGQSNQDPLPFRVTPEQLQLGATQSVDVDGIGIVEVQLTPQMEHDSIIRLPAAGPQGEDVFLRIEVVG